MFWSADTRKKRCWFETYKSTTGNLRLVSNLYIQDSHRHKETAYFTLLSEVALERKVWSALFLNSFLSILVHSIKINFIFPDGDMILKKK